MKGSHAEGHFWWLECITVSEKNPILIQLVTQSALLIYNHEAGLLMGHKPNGLVSSLKKGASGLDSYMMSPTSVSA